ncbi:hypothetical protein ATK30_0577 [Amycolatopsis echigonensis]|uniref:Uncharacterized protein n=1 Tax=Amycolatopsis echigonensis TaxID=2576905 RepID=A0A2N3X0G1_9PSEU|nr:hypothetical protein [Amycolatopsis niigatensis]PKV99597.1 hypothetical protein ATK30_0577 [Amycolatopsis niigatensis]
MGITYCGPYADALADDHEGYAARILPDGTETGTWTHATREFTGYRAHCACGWRGSAAYPATDEGENLAVETWGRDHLIPLVNTVARRHTVTGEQLLTLVRELRGSVDRVGDEQGAGLLHAVERIEELLDNLAHDEAVR